MTSVASPGITTSSEVLSCYAMAFEPLVEAGVTIYPGGAVGYMPDGYLAPVNTAGCLVSAGRAADNAVGGAGGVVRCRYDQGIFEWAAGSNPPTVANRFQVCYWQDDQTVTMTPGTLAAGLVMGVSLTTGRVSVLTAAGVGGVGASADSALIVPLLIADLVSADAAVYYATSPIAGVITNITSILQGNTLTGGNATLTGKIGATAITGGVLTLVQAASALGDVVSVQPTAANIVAPGSKINFTVGGTQTRTTAQANLYITIQP